jgi:hypothetical protein
MPIIRKKLAPADVYPDDIRYDEGTDTVQSLINGDWVDNPDADPRTQTTFPPRITSDPACDAAQSVVDAIHGQIDNVLEAIDGAATLFTIAGIILSIFTFGAYALFVSLALGIGDQMLGFGTAAIEAALTEAAYDTLKCILQCTFTAGGRLKDGGLEQAMSDVTDQIGGIGATIINAMLALAGEGGVNNLASLGTSTGDCSECPGGSTCPLATQDWELGTVISTTEACGVTTITVESEFVSGTNAVRWGTYASSEPNGCKCIAFSPDTGFCDDWYYRIEGEPDSTIHGPVTNAVFSAAIADDCMNLLQVNCGVAFTLIAKFENC